MKIELCEKAAARAQLFMGKGKMLSDMDPNEIAVELGYAEKLTENQTIELEEYIESYIMSLLKKANDGYKHFLFETIDGFVVNDMGKADGEYFTTIMGMKFHANYIRFAKVAE